MCRPLLVSLAVAACAPQGFDALPPVADPFPDAAQADDFDDVLLPPPHRVVPGWCTAGVGARVLPAGAQFATPAMAMASLGAGGRAPARVEICPGTWTGRHEIRGVSSLEVVGVTGDPRDVVLDGGGVSRVMNVIFPVCLSG